MSETDASGAAAVLRPSAGRAESGSALVAASLGGWRGAIDSGLPSAAFLLAYVITGQQLAPALWTAGAAGVLLALVRTVRRQPMTQIVSGFVGLGVCAFIAARTGRAEDFYLPGLLTNIAYAAALVVSVVVRRPLIGYLVGAFTGDVTGWRDEPRLLRAYSQVTWLFVAMFALRVAVQAPLYLAGVVGPLGVARLVMGYPLYLAVVYVAYRMVQRARSDVVALEPAPE